MSTFEELEQLTQSPDFTHEVLGRYADTNGHQIIERVRGEQNLNITTGGTMPWIEVAYGSLNKHLGGHDGVQDGAIVANHAVRGVHVTSLVINDRLGDSRGGSHTDYYISTPREAASLALKEILRPEPELIIELFTAKFPHRQRVDKSGNPWHPFLLRPELLERSNAPVQAAPQPTVESPPAYLLPRRGVFRRLFR